MNRDLVSQTDLVKFERINNQAINAFRNINRAFLNFAIILLKIKNTAIYDIKYNNFKEYCDNELEIDYKTALDYTKVGDFVFNNIKYLDRDRAEILGYKKLKLLSQKLSILEENKRHKILSLINEQESYTVLKERLDKIIIDSN
jgi:hypothetical protein